jgi:uridine phosphorylase
MAKQPHLLVEEGDVHDVALIPGDPGRVDRIASHCDDSEVVAENREYKVVNATYDGVDLTISSTGIGCPSAAIAVEELARVGVETFIRVGTIGGLQEHVETGDMVVATGAAKEEGTSKRYESAVYPAVPDYDVLTSLVDAAEASEEVGEHVASSSRDGSSGAAVHVGPIVSDDAFYNESDEYVTDWNDAGLLAIEMEAATVFSLARRRGLAAGAICTVDGNLVAGTQKGADSDDELPEAAKDNVARAIGIALDSVVDLQTA